MRVWVGDEPAFAAGVFDTSAARTGRPACPAQGGEVERGHTCQRWAATGRQITGAKPADLADGQPNEAASTVFKCLYLVTRSTLPDAAESAGPCAL